MSHQDWTPCVIKAKEKPGHTVKAKDLNAARRSGANVVTEKKHFGGTNKAHKANTPAADIDQDTGDYHINRVTPNFSRALQQARQAKSLTQAQLAAAISEKQSVVADYESGRAIPNGPIISKLNRVLATQLPPATVKAPKKRKGEDEEP